MRLQVLYVSQCTEELMRGDLQNWGEGRNKGIEDAHFGTASDRKLLLLYNKAVN